MSSKTQDDDAMDLESEEEEENEGSIREQTDKETNKGGFLKTVWSRVFWPGICKLLSDFFKLELLIFDVQNAFKFTVT